MSGTGDVTADDVMENTSSKNMFVSPLGRIYNLYLTGSIKPASEYLEWFHVIRHASDMDVVVIHINSYGGDMFTAIQLMQAISESSATVLCSAEGACMSAATLVFLAGDQYQINEFSMFMFHNYSGMAMGKGGEMFDSVSHERAWSERIWRKMYSKFLSKKEIASILDNKDIWMTSDEVIKRLKKRGKKLKQDEGACDNGECEA